MKFVVWRRVLSGGIALLILGIFIIVQANNAKSRAEKCEQFNTLSAADLTDNMIASGRVTRVIGKYDYDYGRGQTTYYIAALPATEKETIRYISIAPDPDKSVAEWELMLTKWQTYFRTGDVPPNRFISVSGRLFETSENQLAAAYAACEGITDQDSILPYYMKQPYHIDYRNQPKSFGSVGSGTVMVILGMVCIGIWLSHYIKERNSY